MAIDVGVDLGTTYTAAAVHRDGRTEMLELGNRANSVPSVVFAPDDGGLVVGEAALRRAAGEPQRVAREYKRRIGDPTPILLAGQAHSAEALTAAMLRWVIEQVTERSGEVPRHVVVAYPANWGAYKQDLLRDAIAAAGLVNIDVITEPEAAVIHYASQERVEEGSVIGVYDLGGGTFDAAIVRKTNAGVEVLGQPEGIERLGGIDFDEAVFAHVVASLGSDMPALDSVDETTLAAVTRLREECVRAKEALSSDTQVLIPVLLPGVNTQIRLTRSEFEAMVRPPIASSIAAFQRAVRSAGLEPRDLDAVLLVGGSSRIPLVAEMVGSELGRPVAVDAHPKHAVALGAALAASAGGAAMAVEPAATVVDAPPAAPPPPLPPVAPPRAQPAAPLSPEPARPPAPTPVEPEPTRQMPVAASVPLVPAADASQLPTEPVAVVSPPPMHADPPKKSSPPWVLIGVAVALLAAIAGGVFALMDGGNGGGETLVTEPGETEEQVEDPVVADPTPTPEPTVAPTATTVPEPTAVPEPTPSPTPEPICPAEAERCIEMSSVAVEGDSVVVDWTATFVPSLSSFHAHFFWNNVEVNSVGNNFAELGAEEKGLWQAVDVQPWVSTGQFLVSAQPPDATEICVTVGTGDHNVDEPEIEGLRVNFLSHCLPVPG